MRQSCSVVGRLVVGALGLVLGALPLQAQDGKGAPQKSAETQGAGKPESEPKSEPQPQRQSEPSKSEHQPGASSVQLARIKTDEVQPRCFAGDRSPLWSDRLMKGDVVTVEGAEGALRRVVLPQGPTGYVHANFTLAPADGFVVTKGANVSLRYRPRSAEAPVQMLAPGVKLYCMGREGDWWKVRCPTAPTYLPADALEMLGDPAVAQEARQSLEKAREKQWQDATASMEQEHAVAAAAKESRTALEALIEQFRAESRKPSEVQDAKVFSGIETSLAEITAKIPAGSEDATAARTLQSELRKQKLLFEARALASTAPQPVQPMEPIGTPTVRDPLRRFDAVGWLRRSPDAVGLQQFRLEKGGRTLYYVTCASGRYDLRMFDGAEVGITGPAERVDRQSAMLLECKRLEVLGITR